MEPAIPNVEGVLKTAQRKRTMIILIIANVMFLVILAPILMLSLTSVMIFGSGSDSIVPWILFLIVNSYPFVFAISLLSWILFSKRKYTLAILVSFLPALNLIALAAAFIIGEAFNVTF